MNAQSIVLYTDGGSRGNPGPSAIGVIIKRDQETLVQLHAYIGETTNNVAEYQAVIKALDWLIDHPIPDIHRIDCYLDSRLVVQQLNGIFAVKKAQLRQLVLMVREKEAAIKIPIHYHHVPREKNQEADRLVNQALDQALQ